MARRPPPVAVHLGGSPCNAARRTTTNLKPHPADTGTSSSGVTAADAQDVLSSVASSGATFLDAWKEFALRKDILNTATGFMIGGAVTSIVNSLVQDVLTPLISWAWQGSKRLEAEFVVLRHGKSNATVYTTLEAAHEDGAVTLNYGMFFSSCIDFLVMSFIIFLLFRFIRRLQRSAESATGAGAAGKQQV